MAGREADAFEEMLGYARAALERHAAEEAARAAARQDGARFLARGLERLAPVVALVLEVAPRHARRADLALRELADLLLVLAEKRAPHAV